MQLAFSILWWHLNIETNTSWPAWLNERGFEPLWLEGAKLRNYQIWKSKNSIPYLKGARISKLYSLSKTMQQNMFLHNEIKYNLGYVSE